MNTKIADIKMSADLEQTCLQTKLNGAIIVPGLTPKSSFYIMR